MLVQSHYSVLLLVLVHWSQTQGQGVLPDYVSAWHWLGAVPFPYALSQPWKEFSGALQSQAQRPAAVPVVVVAVLGEGGALVVVASPCQA